MGISIPFIADPSFWIVTLLGKEYAPAGDALAILAFMVILQSINYPLADNLTTIGQQWKRATTMGIGLAVAVISYIVLGSQFGMMGAAIAAILTEITLLIGFTLFVRKGFSLLFKRDYIQYLSLYHQLYSIPYNINYLTAISCFNNYWYIIRYYRSCNRSTNTRIDFRIYK